MFEGARASQNSLKKRNLGLSLGFPLPTHFTLGSPYSCLFYGIFTRASANLLIYLQFTLKSMGLNQSFCGGDGPTLEEGIVDTWCEKHEFRYILDSQNQLMFTVVETLLFTALTFFQMTRRAAMMKMFSPGTPLNATLNRLWILRLKSIKLVRGKERRNSDHTHYNKYIRSGLLDYGKIGLILTTLKAASCIITVIK